MELSLSHLIDVRPQGFKNVFLCMSKKCILRERVCLDIVKLNKFFIWLNDERKRDVYDEKIARRLPPVTLFSQHYQAVPFLVSFCYSVLYTSSV